MEGVSITVPGSNFGDLNPLDTNAKAYLSASGITNLDIRDSYNKCVLAMKACGAYSKITHLYIALEDTYDKVKRNAINPSGTAISPFTVTLNKGWVLTSAGTTPGANVVLPLTNVDMADVAAGGHVMYFMNQAIAPTNPDNVGYVIGNSESDTVNKSITLSPQGISPSLGVRVSLNGKGFTTTSPFQHNGTFGFTVGASNAIKVWGNGALLGSGTLSGGTTVNASNVTLGTHVASQHGVNNTVSAISVGKTAMTDAEMVGLMSAINTLISEVHGIVVA